VQQGARNLPSIWPSSSRHSPRPKPQAREKPPHDARTISAEAVLVMEQKLREALDRASFECPVVRVENGIYNFGPNIRAVVDLSPDNEVLACLQDDGDWAPIDEFIRNIAQRQHIGDSHPLAATLPAEPQLERRQLGPAAKAAQPYSGSLGAPVMASGSGSLGAPVTMGSGTGAVSSASPRLVTTANPAPPSVAMGRQAAGTTPERVRMPGQPSPHPSAQYAQVALQNGGGGVSNQRMLITPSSGAAVPPVRYGVAVSPGRQMPASSVYQQGASSPRC
jgi:hypothetical protein